MTIISAYHSHASISQHIWHKKMVELAFHSFTTFFAGQTCQAWSTKLLCGLFKRYLKCIYLVTSGIHKVYTCGLIKEYMCIQRIHVVSSLSTSSLHMLSHQRVHVCTYSVYMWFHHCVHKVYTKEYIYFVYISNRVHQRLPEM